MLSSLNLSQCEKTLVTVSIILILYQFFSYFTENKTKDELMFDFRAMFYTILLLIAAVLGGKG